MSFFDIDLDKINWEQYKKDVARKQLHEIVDEILDEHVEDFLTEIELKNNVYKWYSNMWLSGLTKEDIYNGLHNKEIEREKMSPKLRLEILERDNYHCCLCGRGKEDGVKLEVDHKIPIAEGGLTEPDNLWTLCFDCNRGKGKRVYENMQEKF